MNAVPDSPPALLVRDLSKEFVSRGRAVTALRAVNLTVPAGRIHGIVGRSGAGKSTLIRCLTGLEEPTSGEVIVAGTNLTSLRGQALRTARRRFGVVYQSANLLDSRTAVANVALPLEIAGWEHRRVQERVTELLELVGLSERANNYPAQLSGGQQQRVGIARALAAEPEILICDEPTSALDSSTTRSILALLRSLRERLGITIVMITHEPAVVREICDEVTLLDDGAVIEQGQLGALLADPRTTLHRDLIPLVEPDPSGATRIRIALGDDQSSVRSIDAVLRMLRGAGVGAEVIAASIETVAGAPVGRAILELTDPTAYSLAQTVLSAAQLHPEQAA